MLNDEELRKIGQYSEETLLERFLKSKEELKRAEPNANEKKTGSSDSFFRSIEEIVPKFTEQMASNNWVIHGNHTSTGKPILASDPHLPAQLPTVWTLNTLEWGDSVLAGAALPGVPTIGIGRGKRISFGHTTPRADTSDLWQETLSEDGRRYLVDHQWRDLLISEHEIKVKGAESVTFEVKKTHRGPLIDREIINAG